MDTQGESSSLFSKFCYDIFLCFRDHLYDRLQRIQESNSSSHSFHSFISYSSDSEGESSTSSKFFYDVFLSFSGKDTRCTFTGHLYDRLRRDGFQIFKDDKSLRKGDVISTALEGGIEKSIISIVVLSIKYASSSWCLQELVKILQCKIFLKQRVMPIFYDVLPTEVRKQTGEFGKEFAKLKEQFGAEQMQEWAAALTEVANLSGRPVLANGDEPKFIELIMKDVKKEVNHTPLHVASYPVGLDSHAKDIMESLRQSECENEVRMIGIYGLGGIGKTTLAKDIYNRLFRNVHFDGSCFLSDVRLQDKIFGLDKVQEKLVNILLKTEDFKVNNVPEGISLIKSRLGSKKVLIVLDDVDSEKQLEALARERSWFGLGSLIIITTRDKQMLNQLGEKERYEAKLLNDDEAESLFYRHAFENIPLPPQNYVDLAHRIIKYSGGLPLALVTLGSHLRGRSIKEWTSEFKKLTEIPHDDIQSILKTSFDGLPHDTKNVFLDIACAFHGLSEYDVTRILNACRFHTESEIATLVQRNLLQRDGLCLVMHDLVRDMGREIVRLESAQYPGKRSRLFIPEEVCDVLQGNNGSKNIEVLKLDRVGELKGVDLSTEAFKQMKKLRVLIINELRISGDFMLLSKELRWLSWQKCPLNYIPPDFPAANLVVLDMRGSDIEEFGLNLQCCKKLKELNLSYCKRLSKTSNFSGARSLEILQLQYCNLSDTGIHVGIGSLSSLISLDLSGNNFHCLPFDFSKLRLLKELRLNDCENLHTLPPVSNLENLKIFELRNCQRLVKITELDNLPSIESINMCNCSFLQNPFNEGFFSAPALSFPSRNNPYQQGLQIYLECNEIPDWCSNKVTAPSICFTMPKHKYKFLGMVLWFICDGWNQSHFRYFIVTVAHKERFLTWNRHIETPILHGEVSRVYYISHSNRPFNGLVFNGGEEITVKECHVEATVSKIGIHLLYLDQHGNVTSLPAKVDHSYTAYPEEARDRKSSSLTEATGHSSYKARRPFDSHCPRMDHS
ncbi:hypothetical protein T459_07427 [Capsicum annuum]|uniref:TIR domain-containing protein n=1 Tax=Capsicum annuum TaxID=4072 RepID=A0A2G2ZTQ0_CAPAN|nr:hypothetical protein T459_07427 [Capsicum annuum]